MKQLITDERVEAAFDWLLEQGGNSAKAKADKELTEDLVKAFKAEIFLQSKGTVAERNAKADCHPKVIEAITQKARAAGADNWYSNERKHHMTIIEVWRTEQSNLRSLGALQ